jgi:hypothetical protein
MTLRCPVCRAENATGPACRRCRADLSLLAAVEVRRDFHLSQARTAFADGRFDLSENDLARAEELRPGPDIYRLRACLRLLVSDFSAAWVAYSVIHSTVSYE